MKLRALAKINLGLDVTGKREDGYHEVRMVMQTIQMYDQLEIKESKEPGIRLTTNLPFLPCNDGNLVYKAAKILMDEFDIRQRSACLYAGSVTSGWITARLAVC